MTKVGTKVSLMKTLGTEDNLVTNLVKEMIDGEIMADSQQFLVKVHNKKHNSFVSFNELRVKL